MNRTYGKVTLDNGKWRIEAEPHILLRLKRVFDKIDKKEHGAVTLSHSPENCRDLEWFLHRYPLAIDFTTRARMKAESSRHREHIMTMEEIADPDYTPPKFNLAMPARDYQRRAAALYLKQGHLLLADDVGLGKTCSAICTLADPSVLPAVVVTKTDLQRQWRDELKKFAPGLVVVIADGDPHELAQKYQGRTPDVLIITYGRLQRWAEVIAMMCRSAIFDEVQELRHATSEKYAAATHFARRLKFCIGLSATPIYNYGGEMYNVLEIIKPGALGTYDEFCREWCDGRSEKPSIKDPKAFGSYLRENFLMLRRTREEVGRELPPLNRIIQNINSDPEALKQIERSASELARIIMSSTGESYRGQKMQAAQELSNTVRMATGIAKAPYVAKFVEMLVENGEKVLLAGWHRAVYDIWSKELAKVGISFFTGEETGNQKQEAKKRFIAGEDQVLAMSLRAGAGIDGLQGACRTVVMGELDWSPGVHEQFVGRVYRDGQKDGVNVFFLLAEDGSDPIMAEVLGLKRQQIEGIRNPHQNLIEKLEVSGEHVRRLAEQYLNRRAS